VKFLKTAQLSLSKARTSFLRLLGIRERRGCLEIRIDNLTKAQAIAIEDMLGIWMALSSAGSSRWVSFYADGDGNFHPKILVNGRKPQTTMLGDPRTRWKRFNEIHDEGYFIDFDAIAGALREKARMTA